MDLIVRRSQNYDYFGDEEARKKTEIESFFKQNGTLPTQREIKDEIYFISNFDMQTPVTGEWEGRREITRYYLGELIRFFLKEMEMKNFVQICPDLAMYTLVGFLECAGILRRYEEQTFRVLNRGLSEQIRVEQGDNRYLKTYTINGVTRYTGFHKEYTTGKDGMQAPFISDYEVNKHLNRDHYLKRMDFKNLYRVNLATFYKSRDGNVIVEMYPNEYSSGFYSLEDIFKMCEIEVKWDKAITGIHEELTQNGFYEEVKAKQNAKKFEQQHLQPTIWETTKWEQEQAPPF